MSGFARALVLFAHPDDAEFTCGGTVAGWAGAGTEVHYACATDGSAGWNADDGKTREEIARMREEELREAAAALGVSDVRFLGFVDGSLQVGLELRRALAREVRRVRPDVLVAPDPSMLWSRDRTYVNHPDHRAVGQAALDVVVCDAPTRPQFPELLAEGLEPHQVHTVWLATSADDADHYEDIGETIDLKIKALRSHRSQIENMGDFDVDARMRDWGANLGKRVGAPYAESFRTFRLDGN